MINQRRVFKSFTTSDKSITHCLLPMNVPVSANTSNNGEIRNDVAQSSTTIDSIGTILCRKSQNKIFVLKENTQVNIKIQNRKLKRRNFFYNVCNSKLEDTISDNCWMEDEHTDVAINLNKRYNLDVDNKNESINHIYDRNIIYRHNQLNDSIMNTNFPTDNDSLEFDSQLMMRVFASPLNDNKKTNDCYCRDFNCMNSKAYDNSYNEKEVNRANVRSCIHISPRSLGSIRV